MKRFRIMTPLGLVFCLVFFSLGLQGGGCNNPGNKQQNVAFAKDVVNSLQSALPLVRELNPRAGEVLARGIPIAQDIVKAIEVNDSQNALQLLSALLPIINSTAAEFTGNTKVLTILAIADIAVHFLLNHQPQIAKAARAAGRKGSVVADYANQPVWGCQYRPDLCK